jgi:hypothetical protein
MGSQQLTNPRHNAARLQPTARLSISFTALSDWIVGGSTAGVAREVPRAWSDAVGRVNDWHANCFQNTRKEKANENQDEGEGWCS